MDFSRFDYLSFDCYGTLVDWETGILRGVRPVLRSARSTPSDGEILAAYAEIEAAAEAGPFRPYRDVLAEVARGLARRFGASPDPTAFEAFPESLRDWEPFPDTVAALGRLASRRKLVILSNVDDDLFAHTARKLEVPFHAVVTAAQVGSYKPSPNNFRRMLERLSASAGSVLHCAESLYHDIAPARSLGIATVWVNRHAGRPGPSASGQGTAQPDLETGDLWSLADLVEAADSMNGPGMRA